MQTCISKPPTTGGGQFNLSDLPVRYPSCCGVAGATKYDSLGEASNVPEAMMTMLSPEEAQRVGEEDERGHQQKVLLGRGAACGPGWLGPLA